MENSFSFFRNADCVGFPCHKVGNDEEFNCLFCYCPLYGEKECGGNFKFTEKGIKDCSDCTLPHGPKGYEYIVSKLQTNG